MTDTTHALISLEERFAEGILTGTKQVELRRRPMRLSVGATIWLYVKVPIGKVIGSVQVQSLQALAPSTLWRRYGDVSGLCRSEFFDYYANVERGFALVLSNPVRLPSPFPLEQLRTLNGGFQPPQFFQRLASDGPLVSAFVDDGSARHAKPARRTVGLQLDCLAAA